MGYLRNFAPWIVFAPFPSSYWQFGAATALVVAVATVSGDRRAGRGVDLLSLSTAAFFAVVTVIAFAMPVSDLRGYVGAASLGWLAVTAWTSLLARRPFTLVIARRHTPREIWELPGFLSVNVVITAVWAASFTVTAIALYAAHVADSGTGVAIAAQVAGFAVPAVFTARYPAIVQARHQV